MSDNSNLQSGIFLRNQMGERSTCRPAFAAPTLRDMAQRLFEIIGDLHRVEFNETGPGIWTAIVDAEFVDLVKSELAKITLIVLRISVEPGGIVAA